MNLLQYPSKTKGRVKNFLMMSILTVRMVQTAGVQVMIGKAL